MLSALATAFLLFCPAEPVVRELQGATVWPYNRQDDVWAPTEAPAVPDGFIGDWGPSRYSGGGDL